MSFGGFTLPRSWNDGALTPSLSGMPDWGEISNYYSTNADVYKTNDFQFWGERLVNE
jgi:hypothetical protein